MRLSPSVLIVDDDAPSVKLLTVVLEAAGCEVRFARTAEEAFETLRSFHPTVALIELILPLTSGLLLAQRLKADPATAEIVLIAVTALNGPDTERLAHEAGYSLYVRKPIDPTSFVELMLGTD
jgi:CheY-like chemotaxis protein